jgi:hypothetical protein
MTDAPPDTLHVDLVVGSERAPFVFFDAVAGYGASSGVIKIELAAQTIVALSPAGSGASRNEVTAVAHLRCSEAAAKVLMDAIGHALNMAHILRTPPPPEHSAATETVN